MKIIAIGDSLMQNNDFSTFPQTGYIQSLRLFFKDPNQIILNFAKNGSSTKSFIDLGLFDQALAATESGDIVLISFAHNDQKKEDPLRYTDPFKGYLENLEKMILGFQHKNAVVIYIGPVDRCKIDGAGRIIESHQPYDDSAKELMERLSIPYCDLKALRALTNIDRSHHEDLHLIYGAGKYPPLYEAKEDRTHLSPLGAYLAALMVAGFIKECLEEDIFLEDIPTVEVLVDSYKTHIRKESI